MATEKLDLYVPLCLEDGCADDAGKFLQPGGPYVRFALKEFMKTGLIPDLLEDLLSGRSFWDFLKSLTCELPGGQVFTLPTEGLANINLEASMASPNLTPPVETNNRMSRPKAEGV